MERDQLWIYNLADSMFFRRLSPLPIWMRLVVHSLVGVPIVLTVSSVLFLLFEKPFMYRDWPARFATTLHRLVRGREL